MNTEQAALLAMAMIQNGDDPKTSSDTIVCMYLVDAGYNETTENIAAVRQA